MSKNELTVGSEREARALRIMNTGAEQEWLVVSNSSAPWFYGICDSLEDAEDTAREGDVILVRNVSQYTVVKSIPVEHVETPKPKYELS